MPRSVIDLLPVQAERKRDKVFLTENGRNLTFRQVYEQVCRFARLLSAKAEFGDRVALYLARSTDHAIAHFACLSLGLIPVQLSSIHHPTHIQYATELTGARLLLGDPPPDCRFASGLEIFPFPDSLEHGPGIWSEQRHEVASILFTSGTTGAPKGVMLSHGSWLAIVENTLDFAEIRASDRELVTSPTSVVGGLNPLHVHLRIGGEILFARADPQMEVFLEMVKNERITGFYSCPGELRKMLESEPIAFREAFGQLNYLLTNCTPVEGEFVQRLLDALPNTRVHMYYGMTEASRSANICYNDSPEKLAMSGKASKSVELRIDQPDKDGRGEICMRGPNMMLGYWENPEATQNAIDADGWMHSGDFGYMDEDGFVKVLGRQSEQINVDGWKSSPGEIEAVLKRHPEVDQCAVCAIPDKDHYQLVGALVVCKTNPPAPGLETALKAFCRQYLEPYKVPHYMAFGEEIPVNHMGKVQRDQVREIILDQEPEKTQA